LHDNPALIEAIKSETFYPVFIFDGCSAGKVIKIMIIKNTHGQRFILAICHKNEMKIYYSSRKNITRIESSFKKNLAA
jgi:hypothetical protein